MPRRPTCGKLCWSETEAKAIVLAAATYYRHDARRQERHYYFCKPCRAWHTTSR